MSDPGWLLAVQLSPNDLAMPPCCQPRACQTQNLRALFQSFHFFSWFSLFCDAGDAVSVCTRGGPEGGSNRKYIWDPNILTLYFIIQVTLLYVRGDNPQAYPKADPVIKNAKNWHTRCVRWWNDFNIEHTLNILWTYSKYTLNVNIPWTYSEHSELYVGRVLWVG